MSIQHIPTGPFHHLLATTAKKYTLKAIGIYGKMRLGSQTFRLRAESVAAQPLLIQLTNDRRIAYTCAGFEFLG